MTPDDLVSKTPINQGSEFGGVGGMVQPSPHVPTVAEAAMLMRAIPADEWDDTGTPTSTFAAPDSTQVR